MTPEPNQNPIFNRPYWWDFGSNGQPLQLKQLAASNLTLPSSVDCVIVGAGYSGLSAALWPWLIASILDMVARPAMVG